MREGIRLKLLTDCSKPPSFGFVLSEGSFIGASKLPSCLKLGFTLLERLREMLGSGSGLG